MSPEPQAEEQIRLLAERYSIRAEAYDSHWSPVIRPIAERLLEELPLATAERVIDLGTGAGALLPRIRQLAPQATVLGVDRSPGMLRLARLKHHGPLALMDAQHLGLPAAAFDVAVLAFMLFHVPEPLVALAEVKRVLGRQGAVGIATWAPEKLTAASQVWDEELEAAGAVVQALPATDQKVLLDSPAKLSAVLEGAQFTSVRAWSEHFVHRWSPRDHFQYMARSNARWRLESLPGPNREACLKRISTRLGELDAADYLYQPEVVFAVASG